MTRSILAGAALLVLAAAAPVHAQYADPARGYAGDTVRCESPDGRQRFCPADTRGGVRLARQLSRTPCVEGETWGADARGIWVDGGCRGEFLTGRDPWVGGGMGPGSGNDTFRCESRDGRWQRCASQGRRVDLVRQLSDRPCIRDRTWGTDAQGVWVSGGCRAEFRSRGWGAGGVGMQPQVLRCESGDGRRRMCAVTVRGDARLIRQLSRSACIEGQSWGFTGDGIWVDRGCRGEFQVIQRGGGRWTR